MTEGITMNATNNVTTATNYTIINNHPMMGMPVLTQLGNPCDGGSYEAAARGVVVGVYRQQHTLSPTLLVMFPNVGEQGMFALCYHNSTTGESPFYSTNARKVGDGWGKVTSMTHAIRSFGLDE